MKKAIILLVGLLLIGSLFAGVPHPVGALVYTQMCPGDPLEEPAAIDDFEAWITSRPAEVKFLADFGNWYFMGWGCSNEAGNFPTSWSCTVPDEHNITVFLAGYLPATSTVTMSCEASDMGPDVVLMGDAPCAVTLTAFQAALQEEFVAISWTTASEAELNCFNIYRDEVLVHTVSATNTSADVDYQFIDSEDIVDGETYVYDLEVVNLDGVTQDLGSITYTVELPIIDEVNSTVFHNVYPNPISNGDTQKIKLSVKTGETATLTVYNAKGQVVDTFEYEGGNHEDTFTPNYASGIYFYKLEGNNYSAVKKMLILK